MFVRLRLRKTSNYCNRSIQLYVPLILPEFLGKELDEDAAEGSRGAITGKEKECEDTEHNPQFGRLQNIENFSDGRVPCNRDPGQKQEARKDAQDHRIGRRKRPGEPIHHSYKHFSHGVRHCCVAAS